MNMFKRIYSLLALLALMTAGVHNNSRAAENAISQDSSAAVIFAYHRIGEDEYPDTSIRKAQFASHIRELTDNGYNIVSLDEIIAAYRNETSLPDKTVAITFDGGHASIIQNAVPVLLENNVPFTLFVPTDNIDRASHEYMKWDDLKRLAKNKLVTIGLQTASYTHLVDSESEEITRQINKARSRLREELKIEASVFAYPFGETSANFYSIVEKQGFSAAFGQQSGVAYKDADRLLLPRFSMTESYGGLERFRMLSNALPLPIEHISPENLNLDNNRPSIGFSVTPELEPDMDKLSCFASGQGRPDIEIIANNRVELRLQQDFERERARINCTLPGPKNEDDEIRWRWFGMLMTVPAPFTGPTETGSLNLQTRVE